MVPTLHAWPRHISRALCAALLLPLWASAQPRAASAPDPLDASARVSPLRYSPAFAGYKPLSEVPVVSWRAANDAVTRIGGWRVYLRESQPGEAAPQGHGGHGASPGQPGASGPSGHSSHKTK
jgi:hypothetical protein